MNDLQKTDTFTLAPTNFNEAERLAKYIAMSDFAPKDYKNKTANVLLAVQMGSEMGLKPMQSIQNIAVINGRPCVWGDAMLALVKAHQECEYVDESVDEKTMIATCKVKRKNQPICERTFSMKDAQDAQLNTKMVWKQYPKRMLQMRARAFALRDSFPDALKGLQSAEEVSDYNNDNIHKSVVFVKKDPAPPENSPVDKNTGEIITVKAEEIEIKPELKEEVPIKKPRNRKINANELSRIQAELATRVVDIPKFYSFYTIEQLSDMKLDDFDHALSMLNTKPYKDIEHNDECINE